MEYSAFYSELVAKTLPLVATGKRLGLGGELGSGKTTFARLLIAAHYAKAGLEPPRVPSPSYQLVEVYPPNGQGDKSLPTIWHFDFYRLKSPEELQELGWEEATNTGFIIAEWYCHIRELWHSEDPVILFHLKADNYGFTTKNF